MNTRVLKPTPANLALLARSLREGGIAALPTETVYGLAANAFDKQACASIFRAKNRPANDPLIVHVADLAGAARVAVLNPAAERLAAKFWPGPLTMVLPRLPSVPDIVTSGLPTVAVRQSSHRLFSRVLKLADTPLAAPSANPFGYVSPTTAAHVLDSLGGRVPFILDGGACSVGLESTILDLSNPARPRLLRPGGLAVEELEAAIGMPIASTPKPRADAPLAPGNLPWHYSPHTPCRTIPGGSLDKTLAASPSGTRFLRFAKTTSIRRSKAGITLPLNPASAARRLFATLRELDQSGCPLILIEEPPEVSGLWRAVVDRLRKAAART